MKEKIVPYKIITHNGKAHMDELLASALLALHLGEEPETIERIDSQDAALLVKDGSFSSDTFFVDCGMVYDSKRKLFDHHQDRELDSAALLVFNKFFSHLSGTDLHNYIKLVSRVDTRGAMSLDDFNIIGESLEYLSFGQKIMLRTFERDPKLILGIFLSGLEDKIQFEIARQKALLWLEKPGHIENIKIDNLNILKYLVQPPSELVSPLRSAITDIVDENDISIILSFDDKQPGVLTFYRTDFGHNSVDFSRCSPADVIFKHHGGFLMKFKPSDEHEWIKLIQQACTE